LSKQESVQSNLFNGNAHEDAFQNVNQEPIDTNTDLNPFIENDNLTRNDDDEYIQCNSQKKSESREHFIFTKDKKDKDHPVLVSQEKNLQIVRVESQDCDEDNKSRMSDMSIKEKEKDKDKRINSKSGKNFIKNNKNNLKQNFIAKKLSEKSLKLEKVDNNNIESEVNVNVNPIPISSVLN